VSELACPACGNIWELGTARVSPHEAVRRFDNLKPLQRDILWCLYRWTIMSHNQIGRLFSDAEAQRHRANFTTGQMRVLTSAKLVVPQRHGSTTFYFLSPGGIYACESDQRKRPRLREAQGQLLVGRGHWQHRLYTVDVAASFAKEERRGRGRLTTWLNDGDVIYHFPLGGSRRRLQPDGFGEWSDGDTLFQFFLELERTRYDRAATTDKVKHYSALEEARRKGNWTEAKPESARVTLPFPPVLYVATNRQVLPTLRRSIVDGVALGGVLVDADKKLAFGLALLEDVMAKGPLAAIWEAPLQGATGLSLTDLYQFTGGLGRVQAS